MLWHKKPLYQPPQVEELNGGASGAGGGGMFVKLMTDEQMEILSKQITAYATICEQLVDSHKSLTSQHHLGGVRLENPYHDPLLISSGHKITVRQRWTPTSAQLKILERIFEKGNGTPKKEKISEITKELLQHGKISENNVYNWFQNRRARSKRKQPVPTSSNGEPEVDPQDLQSPVLTQELCYQNPETSSAMCSNETMRASKPKLVMQSECTSKPCDPSNKMSFYGTMFPERMDHRLGNMEVPGSYNPYMRLEDYNTSMTG